MVNVFISSYNPRQAAKAQPDLLCQRLCVEAVEVLNAVHWNLRLGIDAPTPSRIDLPDAAHLPPYRRSLGQRRHPIVIWAGLDRAHYIWLLRHAIALAEEHKNRYGGDFPAPYRDCIDWLSLRSHKLDTSFKTHSVKASQLKYYAGVPDLIKTLSDDIIEQYRLSLLWKWCYDYKRKHSWKDGPPAWAFEPSYLMVLRKWYGQPTTLTYKEYFA